MNTPSNSSVCVSLLVSDKLAAPAAVDPSRQRRAVVRVDAAVTNRSCRTTTGGHGGTLSVKPLN